MCMKLFLWSLRLVGESRVWIIGLSGWSKFQLTKILFLFLVLAFALAQQSAHRQTFGLPGFVGDNSTLLVSRVVGPGAGVVSPLFGL